MKKFDPWSVGAIFVLAAAVMTVNGQAPDPNLVPTQPVLARVLDGSWTVTYKYKAAASPSPGAKGTPAPTLERTASIRIDKKGTSYHAVTIKTSGKKAEHWIIKGTEIYKDADGDSFVKLSTNSPFYLDFSKVDFDELSWVGMENYKGVEKAPDGGKLFVFEAKNRERRQTAQESAATGDLGVMVEKLGMVDAKTDKKQAIAKMMEREYGDTVSHLTLDVLSQLPVEYDDGRSIRSYTYTAEPLAIPPELTKFFTKMDEQVKKATVPTPRP